MYTLSQAPMAMDIHEQKYVLGTTGPVQFSYFNSCFGIVVLDTEFRLSAVHLVQFGGNPAVPFGIVQASAIKQLFPKAWLEVGFVGDVTAWVRGYPHTALGAQPPVAAIPALYQYFTASGTHQDVERGDGIYGASVQVQTGPRGVRNYSLHITYHP